jgi:excisionase family DNA binding protein
MSGTINPFDLLIDQVRQAMREEVERGVKMLQNAAAAVKEQQSQPVTEKKWMRAEELARMYNLPRTFFEEKGREGKITRARPGRYVLFLREDVERFLQSMQTGGSENGSH